MRLPSSQKYSYDWYNWHRPTEQAASAKVTFIGLKTEDLFADSEAAMKQDLARSGLTPDYIKSVPNAISAPLGDQIGRVSYYIPYFDLQGNVLKDNNGFLTMHRRRRFVPETADPKERKRKYLQPPASLIGETLAHIPYIHPDFWSLDSKRIIITEGEKKAAAIMAHLKIPAIAIGGCWNWRASSGDNRLHPWIVQAIQRRAPELVIVVPDGDYRRFQIKTAYGGMIGLINELGFQVEVRVPPRDKKIDDLIVEWEGPEQFEGLTPEPMVNGRVDMVEPPIALINRFNLVTKLVGRAENQRQEIIPNASNVHTLVQQHEAFADQFWVNLDSNQMMNGDQPFKEGDTNAVLCYLQYNLSIPTARRQDVYEAIRQIAENDQRSPINEWLKSLKWDRKPRLDTWLIDYIGAPDTPLVREAGLKFMVAAVKRRLEPGCLVDWMLITNGPQAIGKSSLPRILFGPDEVVPMTHSDDGKDFKALFHRGWCVSFEELEAMNKRDVEGLKAIITSPTDVFRPPYGRIEKTYKRRCVLYGSTNNAHFLSHDPSGYRRYVIVPAEQVMFKKLEDDREQLWAEAMYLHGLGSVDPSQVLAVKTSGVEEYVVHNESLTLLEDVLRDASNLKRAKHHGADVFVMKLSEIMAMAGYSARDHGSPGTTKLIANQLSTWGWKRYDTVLAGIRKPYVIPVDRWECGELRAKF
jgi:hypothetical protein